jgi:hypothetical protein
MTRSGLREWESTQRQTAHGAVESEQRVRLVRPVVDDSVDGAQRLGSAYWQQVERSPSGWSALGRASTGCRRRSRRPRRQANRISSALRARHVSAAATATVHRS